MAPDSQPSSFPKSYDPPIDWANWLSDWKISWQSFLGEIAILGVLGILHEKSEAANSQEVEKEFCSSGDFARIRDTELDENVGGDRPEDGSLSRPNHLSWIGLKYQANEENREAWRSSILDAAKAADVDRHEVSVMLLQFLPSVSSEDFLAASVWLLVEYRRYSSDGVESFREWFRQKWLDLIANHESTSEIHSSGRLSTALQEFMVKLIAPVANGSILLRSYSAIGLVCQFVEALAHAAVSESESGISRLDRLTIVASEGLPTNAALVTLLAFGCQKPRVHSGLKDNIQSAPFDWVVALPPIGAWADMGQHWDRASEWKPVPVKRSEQLVFQQCLARLGPGGRACILMPKSFCFAQGQERRIRIRCQESFELESIVNLPEKAAFAGSSIETSLITIFRPENSDSLERVQRTDDPETLFLDSRLYDNAAGISIHESAPPPHEALVVGLLRLNAGLPAFGADLPTLGTIEASLNDPKYRRDFEGTKILEETEALLALCKLKSAVESTIPNVADVDWSVIGQSGWIPRERIVRNRSEWTWRPIKSADEAYVAALKSAAAQFPFLKILSLGEVAEIFPGRSIARTDLVEVGDATKDSSSETVGVIRPAELSRNELSSARWPTVHVPRLSIAAAATLKLKQGEYLTGKDILISREGTIGRCSLFFPGDESAEWKNWSGGKCIANTQLAVIRLKDDGLFQVPTLAWDLLLAQLRSAAAQEWLNEHAQGAVHKRLALSDLERLPILSIDLPQFGVNKPADMAGVRGGANWHLLSGLIEHLQNGHSIETIAFVAESVIAQDASVRLFFDVKLWGPIEQNNLKEASKQEFLQKIKDFRVTANDRLSRVLPGGPEGQFSDWWLGCLEVLSRFIRVMEVPELAERANALALFLLGDEKTVSRLQRNASWFRLSQHDSTLPNSEEMGKDQIKERSGKLLGWIVPTAERHLEELLAEASVLGSCSPPSIRLGDDRPVTVNLTNAGSTMVYDFECHYGEQSLAKTYFPQGDSVSLPVAVVFSKLGMDKLDVSWTAKRLDGKPVQGQIEVPIEVVERVGDATAEDLGTNPYVDARTLQDDEDRVFFGRKPEIARILAELRKPSASTVLLIEGNRRTGKTSLIHHFQKHHLPADWVAAYCTFQSGEGEVDQAGAAGKGVPTREVFFILAKAVVEGLVRAGVSVGLDGIGVFDPEWRPAVLYRRVSSLLRPYFESGPPYEHFRIVLEQCLEALGTRRLLLVIDEFDRLQEGIDSGVTSDQVPENIRHLFQTYNQVAGILTGSRKIRRLREQYWNVLFGIGDPVILRGLEPEAVHDLIVEPVQGRLTYAPAAVDVIAHLTAGQPRIIQTLCSRLFDLCVERETRLITAAMVEEVAEEKARDYEHFKVIWSAIDSPVDQFVALTVNRMECEQALRLSFPLLQDALADQGLRLNQKRLDASLDNLRDLEVIGERIADSTKLYFIEIPLLSRWLLQNQDHHRLRESAQNELY